MSIEKTTQNVCKCGALVSECEGFAKKYKNTPMGKNMNEHNKKALDVMATEGMEAAIKHMFTDEQSGRQLSYSEMRSRFG